MKKILLFTTTLLLATACSSKTKKMLGLTETMPDEYQVKRNKSLEIPPHYKPSESQVNKQNKKAGKLSRSQEALLKEVE